jgi:SAM-dependent methyltransferase
MTADAGRGNYGGQRANMEHDSMRETLAAQAQVLWEPEQAILRRRYGNRLGAVLDLACGTGEILDRVRRDFECAPAIGLDLFDGHLRWAPPPVVRGDGFQLPFASATFDLVLVRHLLQALDDPVPLLAEARRVLREGGRIHVVAEDYMALFFDVEDPAVENHFPEVQPRFRERGTDLYQGRRAVRHLRAAGFAEIHVDPLLVHNQSSDRDAFGRIFRHWGEGYADTLGELTGRGADEMRRRFAAMEQNARDPDRFCGWLLFALDGRKN